MIFSTQCVPLTHQCNAASFLSSQKKETSVLVGFLARDASSLGEVGSARRANTSQS